MYEMKIQKTSHSSELIFRDSFNLMPMALAGLIPAFGLEVEEKPFFPYLSNCPTNYGIRMQTLPPKEDYLCGGMKPSKRREFDAWYEQHQNDSFFLNEALASYCMNDVDILMSALIKFRAEFYNVSKREGQEVINYP
uniref:DNA-directed DNA polymerase n=1 Tax=Meloidogyne enterolobii TaxID=390850 RepID=A0A6V7X1A8_MELEN|nr:unnamed protein product [Meloidogyne enterolobii]